MRGITDMHCHVLPGLDDGPKTIDDSLAVLREAARQGVETMIATPHFHPGRYKVYAAQIEAGLQQLRMAMIREKINLRLVAGQECYYYSGLLDELEAGHVLTMAGTNFVLVEFEPDVLYTALRKGVRSLASSGYRPIIAHFERYRCLYGDVERLKELRGIGAMLQLNFDRLLEKDSLFKRNPWRRLMKDGYVDYLGSDTHGMDFRPLHIQEALAWLKSGVSRETAERVLHENIRLILE